MFCVYTEKLAQDDTVALAVEKAKPRPDMNFKVAAFTVSKKYIDNSCNCCRKCHNKTPVYIVSQLCLRHRSFLPHAYNLLVFNQLLVIKRFSAIRAIRRFYFRSFESRTNYLSLRKQFPTLSEMD